MTTCQAALKKNWSELIYKTPHTKYLFFKQSSELAELYISKQWPKTRNFDNVYMKLTINCALYLLPPTATRTVMSLQYRCRYVCTCMCCCIRTELNKCTLLRDQTERVACRSLLMCLYKTPVFITCWGISLSNTDKLKQLLTTTYCLKHQIKRF